MSRRYRPFDPFERGPFEMGREIRIPRPPRRFWFAAALFALAVLVFVLASPIVWFITELQWYDSLGFGDVFTTRLLLETVLFVASFGLAFLYLAVNVVIALRVRSGPALRAVGISRSSLRGSGGVVGLIASGLVALVLSGGAGTQWQSLALFQHYVATGIKDPVLGQDVSFYLLTLPFLHSVANWALGLAFLGALVVAAMYSWRGDAFSLSFSPRSIAHLSALLAVFALVLAAMAWLGRYDLLYAHNSSIVWGAAYTDVNARLPVLTFETGVGIVLAVVLVANAWMQRVALPLAVAGLWIVMVVASQVYPGLVQSFSVTPNAQSYELPYIQREIAGTRAAYGLANVSVRNFTGDQPLTAQDVQNDQATVNNLRLWDYSPLKETYAQQQTIRTYYAFNDIDLDRYTINGQYQQLEISAREMATANLPAAAQNWQNQHLQYTHGYGVAASPVNAVVGEGLPDYVAGDLPPTGSLQVTQPAIYFGELTNDYALAPSGIKEFDYPQGSQDVFTNYTGGHGVPMTALNKALWSLKLGDFNLLVSGQITDRTQMLFRRNIVSRASELAPFLTFDGDPYIAVVGGKLYWILDAYTTGTTYPYAQTTTFQPASNNSADINYVRNSVKVVIDAYSGSTTFYVVDPKDPIIRAYEATFPSMFKPVDSAPSGIRAHFRVPVDLFNAQVQVYATYHVTADQAGAKVFFAREDVWDIPTAQTSPGSAATPLEPYYVLFRLPGEQNPEFLLIMPFTPLGKNNMVSWMAARNDGSNYGQYVSYVLPKDKTIFGPQQVANRINENTTISADFTLFHQAGSQVQQGNLLVVPIGNSFLYFEPIYLRANQASSLPELKKVILADQAQVVYTDNLQDAINQLVGGAPPPTNNNPPPVITTAVVAQIRSLVTQANQHYELAYKALATGDLTTYGTEMKTVGQLLSQLQALTGTSTGPSPSPSPGATPGASPSP